MTPDFSTAVAALRASGVDNPRLDVRLLWEHAQSMSMSADEDVEQLFESLLMRRRMREPLAYIVGCKEFWSLAFAVGPGVLVPRPETETVIEAALKAFPERGTALDILDLGTGSGCLLAALLHEFPAARGLGIEESPAAFAYAKRNLASLGLAERARLDFGDWAKTVGAYDLVVSNPPYVRSGDISSLAPEVAGFEPHEALDGGADGLNAYRALAPLVAEHLKPGGRVFLEIGRGQENEVKHLFTAAGLIDTCSISDLARIQRVISARRP